MAEQKILIPYNFTAHDQKALNFVINAFANRKEVRVTLFTTYVPLPKIDIEANPEMQKTRSSMIFLNQELKDKEAGLQSVKAYLLEHGFSDDQVDYIFKERQMSIADEIVETASKGQYGVLVLGRQPGKTIRLFARSVPNRLLSALRDVTICIAT